MKLKALSLAAALSGLGACFPAAYPVYGPASDYYTSPTYYPSYSYSTYSAAPFAGYGYASPWYGNSALSYRGGWGGGVGVYGRGWGGYGYGAGRRW